MNLINHSVKAYLVLEDGTVCIGTSIGARGTTYGEICFNTGMTGYQEIFTDPSYYGQIVIMANVHIGNYGTLTDENEADNTMISGLICRNFTDFHSRKMGDMDLQKYMEKNNLVGISNLDTRKLVRIVRESGAMNCIISSEISDVEELKSLLSKAPGMNGLELASKVSTREAYDFGDSVSDIRIAVLDFGVKKNILRQLAERGAYLRVFPHNTSYEEIKAFEPHGYFLSNGPGDPGAMNYAVELVRQLLKDDLPVFGICLGHQLLALAKGLKTYKLHHGHRGINHPVLNTVTGQAEITSQNHGFGVKLEEVSEHDDILISHLNLNDGSVEGLEVKSKPFFSVQYHPEAAPGPNDAKYLFDKFISLVK